MFEKTFKKMGEVFGALEDEIDSAMRKMEDSFDSGRSNSELFRDRPFWSTKTTILKTSAPKFEYKVVEMYKLGNVRGLKVPEDTSQEGYVAANLNALGEEGWQMVQNNGGKVTFMREKAEGEDDAE